MTTRKIVALIDVDMKTPLSSAVRIPRRTAMLCVLKEQAPRRAQNSPIILISRLTDDLNEAGKQTRGLVGPLLIYSARCVDSNYRKRAILSRSPSS